ncbi:MAG: protelomerase family protein [Chroococcidiopsis sp.]
MSESLSDRWLDAAISHATTQWLKSALRQLLPQLIEGQISSTAFADEISSLLLERKLVTPEQQKNPRSNVVQALKSIDPNHEALAKLNEVIALVALPTLVYRELNDKQKGRLGNTQTKYITAVALEQLVAIATRLLDSPQWADVGAGLAVLIGRRVSEILLSGFSLSTEHSLLFADPSKKTGLDKDFTIEIPTLAPASIVLQTIERLQQALNIANLKQEKSSSKELKRAVNRLYSEAIANACDRHFGHLVPKRQDKDNLYTHLFRAVYATIAARWFCPPNIPEHNFKAEIQGHFTIAADGSKLPNYSARANYDDYAISDDNGNRDGRLGLKLGERGVSVLKVFQQEQSDRSSTEISLSPIDARTGLPMDTPTPVSQAQDDTSMPPSATTPKSASLRILPSDKQAWTALLRDICPGEHTQAQKMSTLRHWIESARQQLQSVEPPQDAANAAIEPTPEQVTSALRSHALTQPPLEQTSLQQLLTVSVGDFLVKEIESARVRLSQLERESQLTTAALEQSQTLVQQLQVENTQLQVELDRLRQSHSQLAPLLGLLQGLGLAQSNSSAQSTISSAANQPTASPIPSTPIPQPQPIAPPSSIPTTNSTSTPPRKTRSGSDSTTTKINAIVDALIQWNHSCTISTRRLRIGIQPIKGLASKMGADYQPIIQQVLQERQSELTQLHQHFLLSDRHNRKVHHKDEILQAIAKDFLHLPNWHEVTYP